MTTLASWIAECRDHLEGGSPQLGNQLAANYTAGSGTVTLTNALGNIGEGSWLGIGTNTLLVTAVNTLTKTASVIGGQRGSTDQNALTGDLVRVNPRFTDFQIVREINRHLGSLSSPINGLFQVATVNLAYTGQVEGYDLTGVTGLLRVLEVRRQTYGPSYAWPVIESTWWDVLFNADTTDFASGSSLRVRGGETGLDVQVVYAKEFTPISYVTSTDTATTGVSTTAEDIPPLGAAIRLMSGREVARNNTDAQGDTRRAEETPPGSVAASYRGLAQLWSMRVREESARLRQRYPVSW